MHRMHRIFPDNSCNACPSDDEVESSIWMSKGFFDGFLYTYFENILVSTLYSTWDLQCEVITL